MTSVWRTVAGVVLILFSAPALLVVARYTSGVGVIAAGIAAMAILVFGVYLARRWLGIGRHRPGDTTQPGCLALFVTLLVLVEGGLILYYVVFYGAGAYLAGWDF